MVTGFPPTCQPLNEGPARPGASWARKAGNGTGIKMEFKELDNRTRALMVNEIGRDITAGTLYLSDRLSAKGKADWPDLLLAAVREGTISDLAADLNAQGRLNAKEPRRTKHGTSMVNVPVNAADTLAEGEMNRFYIRAVCVRAIEDGIGEVVVYRARHSNHPRPESIGKIGAIVNAQALLDDLRAHPGVDTALGLPPGPNSGLSVHLPAVASRPRAEA